MFGPRRQVNLPPRYTPTRHAVTQTDTDYVVPVVHPSHTTHVHRHNWKYFHNFPHTEAHVHKTTCQEFICPPAHGPRPGFRGF